MDDTELLSLGENKKIFEESLEYHTVDYSRTEQAHLLMYKHLNGAARLFGGQLLEWIDETAGIVGKRHTGMNITTAAIDNLEFKNAVYVDDIVVLIGYVTHVGRTSMEVRIDTYVERPDGHRYPINRAFFIMVALDSNDIPTPVPRLKVESIEQQAKWDAAVKRIALRKKRRIEGF